ncbi:MAG TPA: ATP-binding protein [Candidatus Eisenbacteria bacterium]
MRDADLAPGNDAGVVQAARVVTIARLALLVLVAGMAAAFSGGPMGLERQLPLGFLLVASGGLALAYWQTLRGGVDPRRLLATQFLVDVAAVSYLLFFTGGAGSQFVPLYLLAPLLGGVFLTVRGGVTLAALAGGAYVTLWAADRGGLVPSAGYDGLGERLSDAALQLRVILYVPLLFVVGVIGGHLGRTLREGRRALDQARAELNQALFDTESILENMSSGLMTVDAEGIIRHWNRAAAEILGLPPDRVRGRPYGEVLDPGLAPFAERLRVTLEQGTEGSRFEVAVRSASGRELPLGLSTSVLSGPDGKRRGVIALFQDLSQVKALEDRARRRETLAAIGELSAGIAHEIRNCLNPISGSVEVLQRELKVTGENARLLDLVIRESERLDTFIRELLDYARERPARLERLECSGFVREVAELARRHPSATPGKRVTVTTPDHPVMVQIDSEQTKQVLMNLVINALEAVDEEGTVEVRLTAGRERPGRARGPGREWFTCIEVRDEGCGIPPQEQGVIFEPFYSTKRGGTGLGLAIANRIVERHGGALEVESSPGAGTTMRVWIPQAERTASKLARAA